MVVLVFMLYNGPSAKDSSPFSSLGLTFILLSSLAEAHAGHTKGAISLTKRITQVCYYCTSSQINNHQETGIRKLYMWSSDMHTYLFLIYHGIILFTMFYLLQYSSITVLVIKHPFTVLYIIHRQWIIIK